MKAKSFRDTGVRKCRICGETIHINWETFCNNKIVNSSEGIYFWFDKGKCWFCNDCWKEILKYVRQHNIEFQAGGKR